MTELAVMLQAAALALQSRGPYALMEEVHRCVEGETEFAAAPWMRTGPYPDGFDDWTEEAQSEWYEDAPQYPSPDMLVVNSFRRHTNGRTMMARMALSPLLCRDNPAAAEYMLRKDVEMLFTRCAETA